MARVATVTIAVGAVIGAETKGIVNYSDATLVVTNAGEIVGGQRTFGTFEFYEDEFAINSYGRLTLTNSATGTVYGGVGAQWLGSTITNAGNIYGTIEMYISQYEFGGRIDVNRDGDTDWSAPVGWSSLNVNAWSAFGL